MKDPMFLTIVFVALSALVATFIRRVKKDKCLKDFLGHMVTLEKKDGKTVWGNLRVFNTGLELVYPKLHDDTNGHVEGSFLLYKHEYEPTIGLLIRYHNELSEKNKKKRLKDLEKAYHPKFFRRLRRKICNVVKTVKDSVMEVVNLLLTQAKTKGPAKKMLAKQDKYVAQMKDSLMGAVGTSYEPLLEMYIGQKVVLETVKGDKVVELCGVLEDYTASFILIMDVDYKASESEEARKADLIVPRKVGIVRHIAERKPESGIEALKKRKKLSLALIIAAGLLLLCSLFAAIKWRKALIEKWTAAREKAKTVVTDVNEVSEKTEK